MISTTVHLEVLGDTYQEMIDKSTRLISKVLDIDPEEVQDRINLELVIFENEPSIGNDSAFRADVTARIRHDKH